MATTRKASKAKGRNRKARSGGPIIIDGGGGKGRPVSVRFKAGEWNHAGDTSTSKIATDSIKRLYVKAGTLEFTLKISSYDEVHIKFDN